MRRNLSYRIDTWNFIKWVKNAQLFGKCLCQMGMNLKKCFFICTKKKRLINQCFNQCSLLRPFQTNFFLLSLFFPVSVVRTPLIAIGMVSRVRRAQPLSHHRGRDMCRGTKGWCRHWISWGSISWSFYEQPLRQ